MDKETFELLIRYLGYWNPKDDYQLIYGLNRDDLYIIQKRDAAGELKIPRTIHPYYCAIRLLFYISSDETWRTRGENFEFIREHLEVVYRVLSETHKSLPK